MRLYALFLLVATATVFSPGPGVVMTLSLLVVVIHCIPAFFAARAPCWLASRRGGRAANRAAGAMFVVFGAALATARR